MIGESEARRKGASCKPDKGGAPAAVGGVEWPDPALDAGEALQEGVDGGPKGTGAFAMDDSDGVDAQAAALLKVVWQKGTELARLEGVEVKLPGDGDDHRLVWNVAFFRHEGGVWARMPGLPPVYALLLTMSAAAASDSLCVMESNPRYLEWRGQPVLLVGSGEHYGVLLNRAFDFERYFTQLQKDGLNVSRVFMGASYVEPEGAFNIERNTLAPPRKDYLAPWAEVNGKWDLSGWNDAYFKRLHAVVTAAERNGVVLELNLFCPFYPDKEDKTKSKMWPLSPFHPNNHVGDYGKTPHNQVYSMEADKRLLAVQEKFVRKLVEELRDAGNVYYEVCNEPYFGGVTMEWQKWVVGLINDAQREHERKKIISLNIANKRARITERPEGVKLFNFHYTYPPVAVEENWDLGVAVGNNETGFRGNGDDLYRSEAWDWLLAGGAAFNHLDYSFTVGHEDGSFRYPETQPGGGSAALRAQLGFLKALLTRMEFAQMKPAQQMIKKSGKGLSVRVLAGEKHAVMYLHHDKMKPGPWKDEIELQLPAKRAQVTWYDPVALREVSGQLEKGAVLKAPTYDKDIAAVIQWE